MLRKTTTNNTSSQDDALTTYKEFLAYAGEEVNQGVQYNSRVLHGLHTLFCSQEPISKKDHKEPELKVHSYNGEPYPLSTAASRSLYCNKLIIRNVQNAGLFFNFDENIIPRIVGIEPISRKASEQLMITYRNIVPSEFSQATSLAGPMGYHEYVIDGSNYTGESAMINFTANSDGKLTPLRIVLENCKGNCMVRGLDEKAVSEIFSNKCDELEFEPIYPMSKPSFI